MMMSVLSSKTSLRIGDDRYRLQAKVVSKGLHLHPFPPRPPSRLCLPDVGMQHVRLCILPGQVVRSRVDAKAITQHSQKLT